MLDSQAQNQLIDIERQFIPDEYRRRLICKATDFYSFKIPTLRASLELPIVIELEGWSFAGTLKKIFLDGYDAELRIPVRMALSSNGLDHTAFKLIGTHATIKSRIESPLCSLIEGQPFVQITLIRRISDTKVVIRLKDLDLPVERYAERLAFMLRTDTSHAD